RRVRLELLSAAFAAYVAFGAFAGQFFLKPIIIVAQPLRADSFLFLLAMLLIAIYSANLLVQGFNYRSAALWAFGICGLLLPLFQCAPLLILGLLCAGIALSPSIPEGIGARILTARSRTVVLMALGVGMLLVLFHVHWSPVRMSLLLAVVVVPLRP